jgi:phosphoglucomutase
VPEKPGNYYQEMTSEFGTPYYTRIDAAATPEQKNLLKKLSPEAVTATELVGEPITAKLTRAPGNDAPNRRWRRHRRTESRLDKRLVCRASFRDGKHLQTLGRESLKSEEHLASIVEQAKEIVSRSLATK